MCWLVETRRHGIVAAVLARVGVRGSDVVLADLRRWNRRVRLRRERRGFRLPGSGGRLGGWDSSLAVEPARALLRPGDFVAAGDAEGLESAQRLDLRRPRCVRCLGLRTCRSMAQVQRVAPETALDYLSRRVVALGCDYCAPGCLSGRAQTGNADVVITGRRIVARAVRDRRWVADGASPAGVACLLLVVFALTGCDPVHELTVRNRCQQPLHVELYSSPSDAAGRRDERSGGVTVRPGGTYGVSDGGDASFATPTVRVSTPGGRVRILRAHRVGSQSFNVEVSGVDCH